MDRIFKRNHIGASAEHTQQFNGEYRCFYSYDEPKGLFFRFGYFFEYKRQNALPIFVGRAYLIL